MGARGQNFYFNLACRYGYEEAAHKIQDAFLDGRREAAVAAVPDALVDEVVLCGPRERIAERLEIWRTAGVTILICATSDIEALTATDPRGRAQIKVNLRIGPAGLGFRTIDGRHVGRVDVAVFYGDAKGNYLGEE